MLFIWHVHHCHQQWWPWTKVEPWLTLCKRCTVNWSCCIGYVCSTSCTKPLTELTTIWLDNVMDGVPPGDVTGCSLSVIVPCHGHLAKWHSTTVFISGVYFIFWAQGLSSKSWLFGLFRNNLQHVVLQRCYLAHPHLHWPGLSFLEGEDDGLSWFPEASGVCTWPASKASHCKCGATYQCQVGSFSRLGRDWFTGQVPVGFEAVLESEDPYWDDIHTDVDVTRPSFWGSPLYRDLQRLWACS